MYNIIIIIILIFLRKFESFIYRVPCRGALLLAIRFSNSSCLRFRFEISSSRCFLYPANQRRHPYVDNNFVALCALRLDIRN